MKPGEDQIKAVEETIVTQKAIHDLLGTKIERQDELRLAKLEVAKAESRLAKATMDHEQYELDALKASIVAQEEAVKKARSPIEQASTLSVPPSLLIKG